MISSHSWWNLYLHFKYFCRSPSKFLRNITIMIFGDPQNFFQRSLSLLMYFLTHAPSIFDTCHTIRLQAVFHLVKKWREEGEECKRQFSKQALEDKGKERLHWLPTVFLKPFNCSYQRDLGLFVYDTSVSNIFLQIDWSCICMMRSVIQCQRSLYCSRPKTENPICRLYLIFVIQVFI